MIPRLTRRQPAFKIADAKTRGDFVFSDLFAARNLAGA